MHQLLRPLLPAVDVALLLTAVLAVWIRAEPLAMSSAMQVALSVLLVALVAVLLVVVGRVERSGTDG